MSAQIIAGLIVALVWCLISTSPLRWAAKVRFGQPSRLPFFSIRSYIMLVAFFAALVAFGGPPIWRFIAWGSGKVGGHTLNLRELVSAFGRGSWLRAVFWSANPHITLVSGFRSRMASWEVSGAKKWWIGPLIILGAALASSIASRLRQNRGWGTAGIGNRYLRNKYPDYRFSKGFLSFPTYRQAVTTELHAEIDESPISSARDFISKLESLVLVESVDDDERAFLCAEQLPTPGGAMLQRGFRNLALLLSSPVALLGVGYGAVSGYVIATSSASGHLVYWLCFYGALFALAERAIASDPLALLDGLAFTDAKVQPGRERDHPKLPNEEFRDPSFIDRFAESALKELRIATCPICRGMGRVTVETGRMVTVQEPGRWVEQRILVPGMETYSSTEHFYEQGATLAAPETIMSDCGKCNGDGKYDVGDQEARDRWNRVREESLSLQRNYLGRVEEIRDAIVERLEIARWRREMISRWRQQDSPVIKSSKTVIQTDFRVARYSDRMNLLRSGTDDVQEVRNIGGEHRSIPRRRLVRRLIQTGSVLVILGIYAVFVIFLHSEMQNGQQYVDSAERQVKVGLDADSVLEAGNFIKSADVSVSVSGWSLTDINVSLKERGDSTCAGCPGSSRYPPLAREVAIVTWNAFPYRIKDINVTINTEDPFTLVSGWSAVAKESYSHSELLLLGPQTTGHSDRSLPFVVKISVFWPLDVIVLLVALSLMVISIRAVLR